MNQLSNLHVVPGKRLWVLKEEGAMKPIYGASLKIEAINFGKELAKIRKCDFVVHNKDGSISKVTSYGQNTFILRNK